MEERLVAVVKGRVQGVGFRAFAAVQARLLGLNGYAKNLPDGSVEVVAEGEKQALHRLVAALEKGPPLGRVEKVSAGFSVAKGKLSGFYMK